MKAVHFGAGNIGRGFIGLILHQAGYEVVFADVNAELISALAAAGEYTVFEVGHNPRSHHVTGIGAVNSATEVPQLLEQLAEARIVTTAVGPSILKFIAPHILEALRMRTEDTPLVVMACENAVNATNTLRDAVASLATEDEWQALKSRAVFANTAVDRIVPIQSPDMGLNVTVEEFCEWTIETGPFGDRVPVIPGAHFVAELAPYIERKLFTVNTGHATTAYFGIEKGYRLISEAIADPDIFQSVESVLLETSELLISKYGFDRSVQDDYRNTILQRFANTELPDTVERVGRAPLRKLSRHERFIAPAAECAERNLPHSSLLTAINAALSFDVGEDEESLELQQKLNKLSPEQFVADVCGITHENPLWPELVEVVNLHLAEEV